MLPVFLKEPQNVRIMKEKEAVFEATVKSSTPVNVKWIVNDKELISKEGVKLEKDNNKNKFTLTIKRANKEHEGDILCKAENEHGSCEKICNLMLIGKLY